MDSKCSSLPQSYARGHAKVDVALVTEKAQSVSTQFYNTFNLPLFKVQQKQINVRGDPTHNKTLLLKSWDFKQTLIVVISIYFSAAGNKQVASD